MCLRALEHDAPDSDTDEDDEIGGESVAADGLTSLPGNMQGGLVVDEVRVEVLGKVAFDGESVRAEVLQPLTPLPGPSTSAAPSLLLFSTGPVRIAKVCYNTSHYIELTFYTIVLPS